MSASFDTAAYPKLLSEGPATHRRDLELLPLGFEPLLVDDRRPVLTWPDGELALPLTPFNASDYRAQVADVAEVLESLGRVFHRELGDVGPGADRSEDGVVKRLAVAPEQCRINVSAK